MRFPIGFILLIVLLSPTAFHAQQKAKPLFVTVTDTRDLGEEERLAAALADMGLKVRLTADTADSGLIHVQVGPFNSNEQAAAARRRLRAAGYALPGQKTAIASGLTAGHPVTEAIAPPTRSTGAPTDGNDLEAQALAKLGGGTAQPSPASGTDLETQALARLGATTDAPAPGGDLETQALEAMKSNEVEAERLHQLALQREQEQREEEARQAEIAAQEQASTQSASSSSGSGGFLNALTGALEQINGQMDQQIAQRQAQIDAQNERMQAQVATNNARREREAQEAADRAAAARARQAAAQQTQQTASSTTTPSNRYCNSAIGNDAAIAAGCYGNSANSSATSTNAAVRGNSASTTTPPANKVPSGSAQVSVSSRPTTARTSGGTAPPPACIYLSPSQPCIPLAQWAQMQAQKSAGSANICPASGFVPGVMVRKYSDVSEGVPCQPGTPYGPLIATTATGGYSGVTPPGAASAGGASGAGSSAGGSGGSMWSNRDGYDNDMNQCITISHKPDPVIGEYMTLTNSCGQDAQVSFYVSSTVFGTDWLGAGKTDRVRGWSDVLAAGGHISIYACPISDTPKTATGGFAPDGPDQSFRCAKP